MKSRSVFNPAFDYGYSIYLKVTTYTMIFDRILVTNF